MSDPTRKESLPGRRVTDTLRPESFQERDFAHFVHDLSEAILFTLERRHLATVDLTRLPTPENLEPIEAVDCRFLRFERIGHGASLERSLDLLNIQNVIGTYRGSGHSMLWCLRSGGASCDLFLGARRDRTSAQTTQQTQGAYEFLHSVRRSVEGNLPGTRFSGSGNGGDPVCSREQIQSQLLHPILSWNYLGALTGIPSLRGEQGDQFVQSLDRLIQALYGERYLLMVVADPIHEIEVADILSDCLRLSSEVHSWTKVGVGRTHGASTTDGDTETTGSTRGDTEALGSVTGHTHGKNRTAPGMAAGGLIGSAMGLMLAGIGGGAGMAVAHIGMQLGSSLGTNLLGMKGSGISDNISESESTTRSKAWTESFSRSLARSRADSQTTALNLEYLSKAAVYCEQMLDGYAQRLQRGKNLGMWNVGVYFLADDPATFAQGQSLLRSLWSGRETYFEPMRAVDLSRDAARRPVASVLARFRNVEMAFRDAQTGEPLKHPLGRLHRSLSTPLTTEETAVLVNLPRREAPGIRLEMVADFGVNPPVRSGKDAFALGSVVAGGATLDGVRVALEPSDLTRHVFVTGITGSGKTNTCFALLKAIGDTGVPALVIEPAKGEYRKLLNNPAIGDVRVYTLGDETVSPFRINPFQFVPGINLITHLDNLRAIFNASFPMYASMPYLLEEALVNCYEKRGWDLTDSSCAHCDMEAIVERWRNGTPDYSYAAFLPTLSDLHREIGRVVESKNFGREVADTFRAALETRIGSLLRGSKGHLMNVSMGIGFEQLYGGGQYMNGSSAGVTVLEMRALGDDDEKCFLMAMLLVHLYEYREQLYRWHGDSALQHLTILEESHRLLGRAAPVGGEAANPRGKAVETFANMLAEIREYGEGFLIVDQTPAKLIPDVVKNTSTKLLHRIAARDDRDTMGDAMGMTDEQRLMVPRLAVGEAIFHSQENARPIWMRVDQAKGMTTDRLVSDATVKAAMAPHLESWRASVRAIREQAAG